MGEVVQMLDFNDAPRQVTWDTSYTAKDVAEAIERDIERYVLYIFPNANIDRGKDARIGNLDGDPGGSLSISLRPEDAGQWMDHNTHQAGNALQLWEQVEGVSSGEAVRQVAQWLGWSEQPLKRSEKAKERATKPKVEQGPLPPPTAVWTYTDADGKPLVLVRRYDLENGDKTYRPYDVVEGKAGMPKVRPLYNLQGIAGSDTVYVVEGEKCADHLISQGFAATTMIGGANGDTKKTDWSPLQGKKIILWRDNDEAGERWQQSLQFLNPAGAVEIPKDKPKGWDAADATEEEVGDLISLVQKIPEAAGLSEPSQSRAHLSTQAWLDMELPPRDYLLSSILCTTSRWMVYGQTGLGKTLFTMNIAAAISTGKPVMGWKAQRKCRVMYLDGEMPAETFQERIKQVVSLYGPDVDLYGYNRDALGDGNMPPLNEPQGETWLFNEINTVKPDLIVFDSIMCLLSGDMKDEESWEPMKTVVRRITSMRIAQIWMHHAGHNAGQSYGTSTRTWEMDTVVRLERLGDDEKGFKFSFDKARLRTHENEKDFNPRHAQLTADGWEVKEIQKASKGDERAFMAKKLLEALDQLTKHLSEGNHRGLNGQYVKAADINSVRDEMKRGGIFDLDKKGNLTTNDRSTFRKAKIDLIEAKKIVIKDPLVWRI